MNDKKTPHTYGKDKKGFFLGETKNEDLVFEVNHFLENESHFANLNEEELSIIKTLRSDLLRNKVDSSVNDDEKTTFTLSHQEIDWLSRNEKKKWVEYLIYRYKFKLYPKLGKNLDFPIHLLIEPTPVCNIKCVMCFQVDPVFNEEGYKGFMDFALFKNVVDQAAEGGAKAITLASRGEPLLHPQLGEMLNYLKTKNFLDIKINTNATRLTEKRIHEILSNGVHEIVFSVDASTKKTYEEIRVGGDFDKVVTNIELFNKIRAEEYPNGPTVTRVTGIKVRDDQDLEHMQEFWSKRVDQVSMKEAIMKWDSYNNPLSKVEKPCSLLWERMYVWADGTVNPCDFDYKSKLSVGNVRDKSLKEHWNGPLYKRLREAHKHNERNKLVPCDRCDYI